MKKIGIKLFAFSLLLTMFTNVTTLRAEEIAVEDESLNMEVVHVIGTGILEEVSDIKKLDDGGFILCGFELFKKAAIVRLNAKGEVLWKKTYVGDSFDNKDTLISAPTFSSIELTADGGYIASGLSIYVREVIALIEEDPGLIEEDDGGDLLTVKELQELIAKMMEEQYNLNPEIVIIPPKPMSKNTREIHEVRRSETVSMGWIVKVDSEGNECWNNETEEFNNIYDAIETEKGEYIAKGTKQYNGIEGLYNKTILLKYDTSGELAERVNMGGVQARKIIETADNSILVVVVDNTGFNGGTETFVEKYTSNLKLQWKKSYGTKADKLNDIVEKEGGGYILCGTKDDATWVLTLNSDGEQESENTFPIKAGGKSIVKAGGNKYAIRVGKNIVEVNENGEVLWIGEYTNKPIENGSSKLVYDEDGYILFKRQAGELISKVSVIKRELNFDANGGVGEMEPVSYLFEEEKVIPSNTFTRQGYVFKGWSTDSNATEVEYLDGATYKQIGKENVTLYAVWEALPVEITGLPESINNGDSFQLTTNIGGLWSCDEEFFEITNSENYQVTIKAIKAGEGNIRFIAESGEEKSSSVVINETYYEVVFNSNGGDCVNQESLTIAYNEEKKLTKNAYTRNSYTFEGWALSQEDADNQVVAYQDEDDFKLSVRANQQLHAIWKPIQLEVTDMPEIVQLNEMFVVNLDTTEIGSLEYDEEYFEVMTNQIKIVQSVGNKIQFKALKVGTTTVTFISSNGTKVEKEITVRDNYYNVSFDANGGVGNMESIQRIVGEQAVLPKNEFTREGYIFEGWSLSREEAEKGNVSLLDSGIYALDERESKTLYAVWKQVKEPEPEIDEPEGKTQEENGTGKTNVPKAGDNSNILNAPKTGDNSNASNTPKTGDNSNVTLLVMFMSVSLSILIFSRKRKIKRSYNE